MYWDHTVVSICNFLKINYIGLFSCTYLPPISLFGQYVFNFPVFIMLFHNKYLRYRLFWNYIMFWDTTSVCDWKIISSFYSLSIMSAVVCYEWKLLILMNSNLSFISVDFQCCNKKSRLINANIYFLSSRDWKLKIKVPEGLEFDEDNQSSSLLFLLVMWSIKI